MLFFIAIFLLIWLVFFSQYRLDKFLINAHLFSWLILFVTDEPGMLRALAAVTLIFTAAIFVWVLFSHLLHKSVDGFLK